MNFKHLALAMILGSSLLAEAADAPKRVLVCTTTMGYRHPSIPYGEEALAAMDAAAPDFEIVGWLRQPEIVVPQAPKPPRKPAPKTPQAGLDKYNAALAAHKKAMETWNRDVKAEAENKRLNERIDITAKMHVDCMDENKSIEARLSHLMDVAGKMADVLKPFSDSY